MMIANKADSHGQSSAVFELRIPLPLHYCAIQTPLRPADDLQRYAQNQRTLN